MYNYLLISEMSKIWGIPLVNRQIKSLKAGGQARNLGGGIVGLPFPRNPFVIGQQISIKGTTNYEGIKTLTPGTGHSEIRFADDFGAETFDGSEHVVRYIGVLDAGSGHMIEDLLANLFYSHNWHAAHNTYVDKILPDGSIVYDFLVPAVGWPDDGIARLIKLTLDGSALYLEIDPVTGSDKLYKFNALTGLEIWNVNCSGYTYGMSLDSSDNVYFAKNPIEKYAAADGTKTLFTAFVIPPGSVLSIYAIALDEAMSYTSGHTGVVLIGGNSYDLTSAGLWNLGIRDLDNTDGKTIALGGYYLDGGLWKTYLIPSDCLVTYNGFIYILMYSPTCTLYKLDSSLNIVTSVAGPTYGAGLFFDLWGNLVVVNQNATTSQPDPIWFYDADLNFLSKIEPMPDFILANWNAPVSGSWIQGDPFPHPDAELPNVGRQLIMGRPRHGYPVEARHACHRRLFM